MEVLKNTIGTIKASALILIKALSVLGAIFAPHLIPPDQIGKYALIFASSLLISNVLNAGLSNQIKAGYTNTRLYWSYTIYSVLLIAAVCTLHFFEYRALIFYIGLVSATSIQMILESLYIKRSHINGRISLSLIYELLPLYIAIFIYGFFSFDYFLSRTIVLMLGISALIVMLGFKSSPIFSSLRINPLNSNRHFIVHSIALLLLVQSPKILEFITTNSYDNLGYFHTSFSLGMLPFFILSVLDSIYQSFELNDRESKIWKFMYIRYMPILLLLLILVVKFLAYYILPFDYVNLRLIGAVGASSIAAFWYSLLVLQEVKRNDKKRLSRNGILSLIFVLILVLLAAYINTLIFYIPLIGYLFLVLIRIQEYKYFDTGILFPVLSLIFITIIIL